MAKKTICDRCGSQIKSTFLSDLTENNKYKYGIWEIYKEYRGSGNCYTQGLKEMDLCHKCRRDLFKWMKDGKKRSINKNGWIPAAELPPVMAGTCGDCSADVLICVKHKDDPYKSIYIGYYGYYPEETEEGWRGWHNNSGYDDHTFNELYEIVAWRPLPEPYEEEE